MRSAKNLRGYRIEWKMFADHIGGDFFDKTWFEGCLVRGYHRNWVIYMDERTESTGKTTHFYTRIRAPYFRRDDFTFDIYRHNFFTRIGTRLGLQDIPVGDPAFDEAFVIQGNDSNKLADFFANPDIKTLIGYQPSIRLKIVHRDRWLKKYYQPGVSMLQFEVMERIVIPERMMDLYRMIELALDHLCEIGTAEEEGPPVNNSKK